MPLSFFLVFLASGPAATAQKPAEPAIANLKTVQQGIALSEQGRCGEALPLLRKFASVGPSNKDVKLKAGLATVRCAMTTDRAEAAVDAIRILNRDFPADPDVLYATVHAYSDLSTRASLALVRVAPSSYQARQLNAESLEAQGRWDEAAHEYQAILKQDPRLPGIHFRIGRCILSKEETSRTAADAQKEFEAELEIDPNNAGAEYILGELAQHASDWDRAIAHYGKAAKLSPGFAEAQLGLGMAYVATNKFEQAVAPLEIYTKIQPANPAGHYQLMMAYSRTGRKEDAAREAALQRQTAEKLEEEKQRNRGVTPAEPPAQ
ncbi:MAG TPA: tetratricopeptide repeat protein [Candidatus Saccharimonadales bacterium]|nr:tetratricopeptide repeat protein [Candidatus Saccharimonadales bacterium]